MQYTVVISPVVSKDALTRGDEQIAAGMKIVFGVNIEVS
jgi:hypothetical protein